MPTIRASIIQVELKDTEDAASRFEKIETLLNHTRGSQLIVLPELWGVGYFAFDQYAAVGESLHGKTFNALCAKAMELDAYIMAGSIIERDAANRLYNTSLLIARDGTLLSSYRKVHLFGYESEESRFLVRGEKVEAVATPIGNIGMSICFDLRFPEFYRKQLDQGAELFLVAASWPQVRLEHWQVLARARALENQSFLAAANCAGMSRGNKLAGHSIIVDPTGKILAEAGEGAEVITADIDLSVVQRTRINFPSVHSRVLT
ncbi:MAG: carbon-nitrogen family hydrolase [Deltaproteobacteria bacterium]|nr:carbon-nitrogen family hydrolase [Deltaproteobacteria bacterium]